LVTNESIDRAVRAISEITPIAEADATRPVYHFRPPAGYHNDPNGPIWHNGYYHLFYQYHPFTGGRGKGDRIYWGHARSADLIHWEHLPPAIWPSEELGETICASGSTVINSQGRPMIFYTSAEPANRLSGAPDQWAALGSDDLVTWRKHPANPVLTKAAHGDLHITQWRDPFVFEDEGYWYMVLGGRVNRGSTGRGCLCIYRATNDLLTNWEFLNILHEFPDESAESLECPALFRMGKKWLLFFSHYPPATQVVYMVGHLDKSTFTFQPEFRDKLEYSPMGMYAPTAMRAPDGRVVCWGWMRSPGWYPGGGRGWNGCMTLPREFSIRSDGWLVQEPVGELEALRDEHFSVEGLELGNQVMGLPITGDALEIDAEFERGDCECGLIVRRSRDGERGVKVSFDGEQVHITGADPSGVFADADQLVGADYRVPFRLLDSEASIRFHLFIDKCVLEMYLNGRACFSRAIYPAPDDLGVAVYSGGRASIRSLDAWKLKPAWDR
jgi:beta-fructofuranosidase